jgi:hypothetical protein
MLRKTIGRQRWLVLIPLALALVACGKSQAEKEAERAAEAKEAAYREKYAKAKALFEERCKTAGVVVKRTVKDVEGIELIKVRQPIPWGGKEYFDPMYPEAAMAGEHRGDDYIKQFLMSEFRVPEHPERRGQLGPHLSSNTVGLLSPTTGYRFVEYVDASNHQRYRCTATWQRGESNWVKGQHRCEPTKDSRTRYALDYEDLVAPADRALWVAGTKLKVIDKQTGETVAELTKYVWDPGFGVSTTGRWPWQHAAETGPDRKCPSPYQPTGSDSRYFVDTILQTRQGE